MIHFALACAEGHTFDGWFASARTFEQLLARGDVACTICGGRDVRKALMAPAVTGGNMPARSLTGPQSEAEAALARLRQEIESNSDYVGLQFAAEARAMHEGDLPSRAIWGEANPDEARALIEDGVPVAPLPFLPRRKAN